MALVCMMWLGLASRAAAYTNADLVDAFNKTVFASEYSLLGFGQGYVRKFEQPVRVIVHSTAGLAAKEQVEAFVLSLPNLIENLDIDVVQNSSEANFAVYVVQQHTYAKTVRNIVFKDKSVPARGRCMVRSVFTREAMTRSDAVIVADDGEKLFSRCMTEEILQGLGPLNDDRSLVHSMFNDGTAFTSFRRFDRLLLNMLYDERIKHGASRRSVQKLLPVIARDNRRRIEGR